ncbi:MAG TPA: hypothetical protein VF062_05100 [Candidatus Limnocylindrales bacterium]
MLGRLLWGLAFQRREGALLVIDRPFLDPNPFDAAPASYTNDFRWPTVLKGRSAGTPTGSTSSWPASAHSPPAGEVSVARQARTQVDQLLPPADLEWAIWSHAAVVRRARTIS